MAKIPNPGTPDAVANGCICDAEYNDHGKGHEMPGIPQSGGRPYRKFFVGSGCLLHDHEGGWHEFSPINQEHRIDPASGRCAHDNFVLAWMTQVPISDTDPIAHTEIRIFACRICKNALPFPAANWALVTLRAREAIVGALTVFGYTLPTE